MRTHIALATSFYLALAAGPALAQNPSYEGRGYGGPLYVGPNFEQGGQHTPPVYGTKPAKKRAAAKPPRETSKAARKAASKKDTTPDTTEQKADQASSSVAPSADPADSSTGTTTGASTSTGTATSTATTCKRFDSTAGQTITVPCQ
jgi:outer membrane biosynthesis protein TonB